MSARQIDNITVTEDDITKAVVDAIVNAANPMMLGGGGVDGAIHRAAGPELLEACRRVKAQNGIRCPVGESRITPAGRLKAEYVIHTVGPRFNIDDDHEKLLASAYYSSLLLATEHECTSIAFPAISCGAYGYPIAEAAAVAIHQCSAPEFSGLHIQFYLYGKQTYQEWMRELDKKLT